MVTEVGQLPAYEFRWPPPTGNFHHIWQIPWPLICFFPYILRQNMWSWVWTLNANGFFLHQAMGNGIFMLFLLEIFTTFYKFYGLSALHHIWHIIVNGLSLLLSSLIFLSWLFFRHGGTCYDRVASFVCECPAGITGLLCHLEDSCASNPCHRQANCEVNPTNGESYI